MSEFFQAPPEPGHPFTDDRTLQRYLRRALPPEMRHDALAELEGFATRVRDELMPLGAAAHAQEPRHVPYDPWGRRIDHIEVSPAWHELQRRAAREGLVSVGYERVHGRFSRLLQFARLYLFHPASGGVTCPLAMTDGAARTLELYGDAKLKDEVLPRLTSRDPDRFWTSGQWMTERTGGSDVGRTTTVARQDGKSNEWRLYGTKWFTSATTSEVALTLARPEGAPPGSRALGLFLVTLRDSRGQLRRIHVHRLKDKLGTRSLPTAELTLDGTPARLVGGEARDGVKKIASMLNLTRLHNATSSVATLRHGLALARDYAGKRQAFGRLLRDHPLHLETLADLEVELQGAFHLTFFTLELLGKEELGEASAEETLLLRLLTSLVKLSTARQAVAATSEVLECFGGAGYVEDTGLPRLLRDAQVLPIWEGTTNVLSLDALRTLERGSAFEVFVDDLSRRLRGVTARDELAGPIAAVRDQIDSLSRHFVRLCQEPREDLESEARRIAQLTAALAAAGLLIEAADWSLREENDPLPLAVARRWCASRLTPLPDPHPERRAESRALALDVPLESA